MNLLRRLDLLLWVLDAQALGLGVVSCLLFSIVLKLVEDLLLVFGLGKVGNRI